MNFWSLGYLKMNFFWNGAHFVWQNRTLYYLSPHVYYIVTQLRLNIERLWRKENMASLITRHKALICCQSVMFCFRSFESAMNIISLSFIQSTNFKKWFFASKNFHRPHSELLENESICLTITNPYGIHVCVLCNSMV